MTNQIFVNGTQITVTTIEDKDYISLTDMIKAKDGDFLFRIDCATEIRLNFQAYGNRCITLVLIMANSP